MQNLNSHFDTILAAALEFESTIDTNAHSAVLKRAYIKTTQYARSNLSPYLGAKSLLYLQVNLFLHFFITDPASGADFYGKYEIADKDSFVTSVTSAGASTTIQPIKTIAEGDFLTLDLNRTPYGREAYTILNSIQGIVIT